MNHAVDRRTVGPGSWTHLVAQYQNLGEPKTASDDHGRIAATDARGLPRSGAYSRRRTTRPSRPRLGRSIQGRACLLTHEFNQFPDHSGLLTTRVDVHSVSAPGGGQGRRTTRGSGRTPWTAHIRTGDPKGPSKTSSFMEVGYGGLASGEECSVTPVVVSIYALQRQKRRCVWPDVNVNAVLMEKS